MSRHPYRRNHGFTMIELMVTLAVFGILVAVGVPSFNNFLVNSRTSAVANDITSAVNLARSEAVKRGAPVTVCPSENNTECVGTWTDGWIVMVNNTSEVLRVWRAPAEGASINQTGTANSAIRFGALGQRVSAATQLDIEVSGCRGNRARQLDVGPAGRISVQRVACTGAT